jgi:hypothetical protein
MTTCFEWAILKKSFTWLWGLQQSPRMMVWRWATCASISASARATAEDTASVYEVVRLYSRQLPRPAQAACHCMECIAYKFPREWCQNWSSQPVERKNRIWYEQSFVWNFALIIDNTPFLSSAENWSLLAPSNDTCQLDLSFSRIQKWPWSGWDRNLWPWWPNFHRWAHSRTWDPYEWWSSHPSIRQEFNKRGVKYRVYWSLFFQRNTYRILIVKISHALRTVQCHSFSGRLPI